jgi:hypothetical protein
MDKTIQKMKNELTRLRRVANLPPEDQNFIFLAQEQRSIYDW